MPCRDYYDDHPEAYYGKNLADKDKEIEKLKKQISFAESALCASLKALENVINNVNTDFKTEINPNPLVHISYNEAGITPTELAAWHKKHKALDAKHREQERLKKVKEEALAKLSDEEKRVLGIK